MSVREDKVTTFTVPQSALDTQGRCIRGHAWTSTHDIQKMNMIMNVKKQKRDKSWTEGKLADRALLRVLKFPDRVDSGRRDSQAIGPSGGLRMLSTEHYAD